MGTRRCFCEGMTMSRQIVEQAKSDLLAAGKDLSGNNGAFLITMEAASRIPGAGVLDKPSGNHAEFQGAFYAVDIIAFPDGRIVDVLTDGGRANGPTWDDNKAPVAASRFRPAVSILEPKPQPDVVDLVQLSIVMEKLQVIDARINDVGAKILHIEEMIVNLRSAVQVTDERVERTYQDLVNRLNAIANIG